MRSRGEVHKAMREGRSGGRDEMKDIVIITTRVTSKVKHSAIVIRLPLYSTEYIPCC